MFFCRAGIWLDNFRCQAPDTLFLLYYTNAIATALAGGDDYKRRVLYWFFAFVTILKYVIGAVGNVV